MILLFYICHSGVIYIVITVLIHSMMPYEYHIYNLEFVSAEFSDFRLHAPIFVRGQEATVSGKFI